jgi:hypothetical protein
MDPRLSVVRPKIEPEGAFEERLGRHLSGELSLAELFRLDPKALSRLSEHALALLDAGRPAEARSVLSLIEAAGGGSPALTIALAMCAQDLGEAARAEELLALGLATSDRELADAARAWAGST